MLSSDEIKSYTEQATQLYENLKFSPELIKKLIALDIKVLNLTLDWIEKIQKMPFVNIEYEKTQFHMQERVYILPLKTLLSTEQLMSIYEHKDDVAQMKVVKTVNQLFEKTLKEAEQRPIDIWKGDSSTYKKLLAQMFEGVLDIQDKLPKRPQDAIEQVQRLQALYNHDAKTTEEQQENRKIVYDAFAKIEELDLELQKDELWGREAPRPGK